MADQPRKVGVYETHAKDTGRKTDVAVERSASSGIAWWVIALVIVAIIIIALTAIF